ncbi:hypothetical protein GH733_005120 [Mirounga leonina]|nr:hypothetical protein GH733_005120 [Mirounga leonina]
MPSSSSPDMKNKEDNNTLVFTMDAKANEHQIKQAVKTLYDIDKAKVDTHVRFETCRRGSGTVTAPSQLAVV